MITYTSKNHSTCKRNRQEFHGPIDLEAYPITRYQRAGDDIDHPIIGAIDSCFAIEHTSYLSRVVDDYKIDETLKPIWSDPSHHRGLGSASCPPVLEDGPRPRSRKRYFKSASPTSTDDEGLVPVEFVPPPDSRKSVEVVIEYPPGFDEFKRTYIPAEQAGGQDIRTVPKPKAKQLNESGPSPALQPESRLKKKSNSGPEDLAKAPQKSRGNGRRKDGKTAYDIPGAKLLFDSFPEPAEEPESVAEGSRSRVSSLR
ncbi:hypothetical protein SCHPADRAFT_16114 [Schizopora paradoxa]|uniref:Uncharacterized protein n=1 Tax=Schizopora paradoxa TaxID=27342 RepID=A0A0H2SU49_9AGAM|nr:hypothetical protein SCHPADRAFT_16114 [Schizopora paradoxa]